MKTHENLDKNWISKGSLDWFPVKISKKKQSIDQWDVPGC